MTRPNIVKNERWSQTHWWLPIICNLLCQRKKKMERHCTFVFSTFCIDLHFDCTVFCHILKCFIEGVDKNHQSWYYQSIEYRCYFSNIDNVIKYHGYFFGFKYWYLITLQRAKSNYARWAHVAGLMLWTRCDAQLDVSSAASAWRLRCTQPRHANMDWTL